MGAHQAEVDRLEAEIRGHHSMRDHLLTVVSEADLAYKLPGQNPTHLSNRALLACMGAFVQHLRAPGPRSCAASSHGPHAVP
jgi:hypothetical protein